jgi:glycosyltransferase involved in cell wall biosynthesis
MKILHTVESYLPLQHGMSEVVRQISEYLVKKGHEVVVATSYCKQRDVSQINGVEIKSFKISGNFVNGYSGEIEEYKKYILNSNFDIISNFAAQQWATDLCFEILPNIQAKKYFIPTGFSKLKNNEYSTYFNKMKTWMQYYDLNIFLSSNYQDVQFAKEAGINKIELIPNGASYSEFIENHSNFSIRNYLKLKPRTKIILHIGSYTGLKGHDDALKIYLKTKQKDTALVFVGENFEIGEGYYFKKKIKWFNTPFDNKKSRKKILSCFLYFLKHLFVSKLNSVYIIALKRQDLVETFKQADLFLFPSQIECSPVVLFEACAAKTPFIVTNVGNSEEIVAWTGGGIVMPTYIDKFGYSRPYISESAQIISRILQNTQMMSSLSENGFKNWIRSFTWEKIAEKYEKIYLSKHNYFNI